MITIPQNMQELLNAGNKLRAGQMVATNLVPKMEIYGFVPHKQEEFYLDFNMQDTRIVANRLVVIPHIGKTVQYGGAHSTVPRYPIYKAIAVNQEEKSLPLRLLRVVRLEGISYFDAFQRKDGKGPYFKDPQIDMVKQDNDEGSNEGSKPYYKLQKGDILFYEQDIETIKAVADCFLVLCRRINDVTGCMTYELYNAEDLCPITEETSL